jgi:hypothetical protein
VDIPAHLRSFGRRIQSIHLSGNGLKMIERISPIQSARPVAQVRVPSMRGKRFESGAPQVACLARAAGNIVSGREWRGFGVAGTLAHQAIPQDVGGEVSSGGRCGGTHPQRWERATERQMPRRARAGRCIFPTCSAFNSANTHSPPARTDMR